MSYVSVLEMQSVDRVSHVRGVRDAVCGAVSPVVSLPRTPSLPGAPLPRGGEPQSQPARSVLQFHPPGD